MKIGEPSVQVFDVLENLPANGKVDGAGERFNRRREISNDEFVVGVLSRES